LISYDTHFSAHIHAPPLLTERLSVSLTGCRSARPRKPIRLWDHRRASTTGGSLKMSFKGYSLCSSVYLLRIIRRARPVVKRQILCYNSLVLFYSNAKKEPP